MLDKLDDYARRPKRYLTIDGIYEMGIGFWILTMTLLGKSLWGTPGNFFWHWVGTLAISTRFVVWFGTVAISSALPSFVVLFGVRALKERITYRRTGFVKYRGPAGKRLTAGLIAGAIGMPAALLLVFYLVLHSGYSAAAAVRSAMWGLLYAFGTRLGEAWRWVVLAVILLGPVAISMLPLDRASAQGLPTAFMGLTLLVSGGIAFYLYLRRTRRPEQEAE
jgi:hypothetical protein